MFQKFKITFYTLIVLLVLVLPSHATHTRGGAVIDHPADSCAGWDCSYEGQVCPQGAEGASSTSYICTNSKWVPTNCDEKIGEHLVLTRGNLGGLECDSSGYPQYNKEGRQFC